MDSQYLLIDDGKLIDHRPGVPDMTLATGTQDELRAIALRIVSGIGWEMVPVYVIDGFRIWHNINTN